MTFKFHRRARFNCWSTSIENIFNKDPKQLISFNSAEEMLIRLIKIRGSLGVKL